MILNCLKVFFLSMTPFGELRISIPIGIFYYHLPLWLSFVVSLVGNILIILFLLLFFNFLSFKIEEKFPFYKKFISLLKENKRQKYKKSFKILGSLFLIIFVAIPLPFSGGWSGSLLASVFRVPFKKSFLLISLGVFLAGIIILLTSLGVDLIFHL